MKKILEALTKLFDFRLKFNFFIVLVIALVVGVGLDYFLSHSEDVRVRLFIYGVSLILIFVLHKSYHTARQKAKRRIHTQRAVKTLTFDECKYVMKCQTDIECLTLEFNLYASFQEKWKHVLFIPHSKHYELTAPYQIFVYPLAYKLIVKRVNKEGA